jgi:hypothetical protein
VTCHGPIPQAQFLMGLGATERLQGLLEAAQSDAEAEQLISGYKRLVGGASSADEQVIRTWCYAGRYCFSALGVQVCLACLTSTTLAAPLTLAGWASCWIACTLQRE